MELSVVVPTLNGRERLGETLDALAEHAPEAEVVVANGPSADGTTGMVRARDDVAVLVEVSARTLNVARNAGIEAAGGDVIALVGQDAVVEPAWRGAITDGLAGGGAAVTGPARRQLRAGVTAVAPERGTVAGREVTYFDGGNVAFRREALAAIDGFDEYLETGGARDVAHRLAGQNRRVVWRDGMCVRRPPAGDDSRDVDEWGWKYRALAYRLAKSYGLRPAVVGRIVREAAGDGIERGRRVLDGEAPPTAWLGAGRAVLAGTVTGVSDGLVARSRDGSRSRNPHGLSRRHDRAVARYDRRP